ncbi:hypothetical protein RND71_005382 [Anisodus tanguticus]|uniref:Uncharacterized protein n=1 Tax=Anisodus tanguticus TaxID=243964 RepID=A0AAE1SRX1_9SOLA|nr:hypothetical protein RND71_005382 [Anisodus tanguticus]
MKQRGGKRNKGALIMSDSKLLFVIRIGGEKLYASENKKAFILFKAAKNLQWGLYTPICRVKDLLYKKGSGKIDNQRVPLTSNDIVEQTLGQHGIICLEDVVGEISNVGPHFKEVTSFLCPFSLTKPEKALQGKKRRYNNGGDSGNREDHINELISKMN